MKGNVTSLNSQEKQITESYLQYRTTALTTAEIELMALGEARYLFTPHVFRLILPEVVMLMREADVSEDNFYSDIIKQARYAIRRDGLYPDDYNLPLGVAVFVIWLDFCCGYKSYGKVYNLKGEERGYKNNKRDLQFVVFFWCMNYGLGYATGKAKKMQEVFLSRINIEAKVQKRARAAAGRRRDFGRIECFLGADAYCRILLYKVGNCMKHTALILLLFQIVFCCYNRQARAGTQSIPTTAIWIYGSCK